MADHSPYQRKVIERYYENRDDIALGKLGEIVTELALAETDRRRNALWNRAEKAMRALSVSEDLIKHVLKSRSEKILANNLRHWLAGAKGGRATGHSKPR